MYEIRIHGRGGQGAVVAATLLAQALVEEGRHALGIPSFGFERRGAPVAAFLRFSDRPIRTMTNIYSPDCVLCIDPTVRHAVDIFAGMKPGGTLVLATKEKLAELGLPAALGRVGLCDAVGIALAIFRKPITNSVMLGAFARTTGAVSLASLQNALHSAAFRDAGLRENMQAMERGFAETQIFDMDVKVAHATAVA